MDARRDRGLTLLELLVAMSLSALLLSLLSEALYELRQAAARAATQAPRLEDWQRARAGLHQLLSAAVPATADRPTRFEGTDQQIAFVAASPRGLQYQGLLQVRIGIESNVQDLSLIAQTRPLGTSGPWQKLVLLAGLQSARFTFQANGAAPARERWEHPRRLPAVVTVRWRGRDEVAPPVPVVVALRRGGDTSCSVDASMSAQECADGR